MPEDSITVLPEQNDATLAAILRARLPNQSWNQIRRFIETRRVRINGELCLDPARRLQEGQVIEILERPAPKPRQDESIKIVHLDTHLVVVEKPSGISTVRHPLERDWPAKRKALSPTLDEIVPKIIAQKEGRLRKGPPPRLRIVHRIDKETSGLVVFARTVPAEQGLGKQFRAHSVLRRYLAIIPGTIQSQRIATRLVRDRCDGRRGSTKLPGVGKQAVTNIELVEKLAGYSLVSCQLETGRTHQIRIHLAELGHPVCGEKVYNRKPGGPAIEDQSGAPRLVLHAAELGFVHPVTGLSLHWSMPLPPDLQSFLARLRTSK
ncbi:MAG TPA: RluA family pseudouridine synthase [Gemmataceae bacterium]|jgi:23S rRNA pseudouridine1911/1915/1917 synthase|nr:RluA family pseudouridine synthase [Gemmataceae bacterium]